MRADVHMHTAFSHDSQAKPEEMIEGAIQKQMKKICLTDHFDKDDMEWGEECIFPVEEYFKTLQPLKEAYRDKIDVGIGVELGLRPYLGKYYRELTASHPFDFIIGSVHCIQGEDPAKGVLFQGKTDMEVYKQAMEANLASVRACEEFDVLGHLDYVVRYGREKEGSYRLEPLMEIIDEILRLLVGRRQGLEVNTAGLKYGLSFPHPHKRILQRYRELGGEIITMGSDAHSPEHIGYRFTQGVEYLKACGFKYYTEFSSRIPVFKQLP